MSVHKRKLQISQLSFEHVSPPFVRSCSIHSLNVRSWHEHFSQKKKLSSINWNKISTLATYSNHHPQKCFLPQGRYQYLQVHHPQYIIRRRFANATLNQVEIHRRSRECCMTMSERTWILYAQKRYLNVFCNGICRFTDVNYGAYVCAYYAYWPKQGLFINWGTISKVPDFWFRVTGSPKVKNVQKRNMNETWTKHERNMNDHFHWTFMNEFLGVRSYRSSLTNELVHASFMFDSFMNDFCRFHFYRSFSDERTKNPTFFVHVHPSFIFGRTTVRSRGYKRREGSTNPKSHSSFSHQPLTQLPTTRTYSTSWMPETISVLAACSKFTVDSAWSAMSHEDSTHLSASEDIRILSATAPRFWLLPTKVSFSRPSWKLNIDLHHDKFWE